MSAANRYARPELLAEPEWVREQRDNPLLRLIDCGDPAAYARAHVPGAVPLLDAEDGTEQVGPGQRLKDANDPIHVMGPAPFAALMERLGVSEDTTVVAYDDRNGTSATRLWWVLTYYGHADVKVLNGGRQRWLDEGRPATFRETAPDPGRFTPRPKEAMRVRADELLARYADPDLRVVNVLWPEMYASVDNPFNNRRAGHIPGSVNAPIERFFVDGEVPILKPAVDLRAALEEAGLSLEQETVVHCQAGVRTTVALFVTSLLGWDRVRAYEASMAEWANRDETPLTTGEG